MKTPLSFLAFLAISCLIVPLSWSQTPASYTIDAIHDPAEVRMVPLQDDPTEDEQRALREQSYWNEWGQEHPRWRCIMGSTSGLPHRAFGPGIEMAGSTVVERAQNFVDSELSNFGIEFDGTWMQESKMGKHQWAFAQQKWNGIPVKGGRIVTKWLDDKLVMWGADWYLNIPASDQVELSNLAQIEAAMNGVELDEWSDPLEGDLMWVPTRDEASDLDWHKVKIWYISGRVGAIPRRYETGVDVHTGEVIWRQNRVLHIDGKSGMAAGNGKPERTVHRMGFDRPSQAMVISGTISADVHELYPYIESASFPLPALNLPIAGGQVYTDADGGFISEGSGPQFVDVSLEGLWSTVYTNGTTPNLGVQFEDGYNDLDLSSLGNKKERSAYRSVSLIHDHMKVYMSDFTDLDWSLPTNIDVQGECNAFYDGQSVNFYDEGGGCNPTSLIADVVWHEYGHGINDYYYSSLGSNFNNGAMGEGYADLWAMSLGDIAEIGKGFYSDNEDGIRRYDIDPKVYPEDLVGEVHADGEIICGAWYDTHLLMGGDWAATMELFVDAYAGLQATAPNGSEGQAFTDVLIDVLQADDDDGDLSNGTPNAAAIVEGFDIHGISVFSYAEIDHNPEEFAEAESTILVEAETFIVFPYSLYFDAVNLWYQTEIGGEWNQVAMENPLGNGEFIAEIPAQPAGSVIAYYMGITDDFGGLSAVNPFAASNEVYPNLPHYLLVGVEPVLINDSDEYSDFGAWTTGIPGQDNATTGIWEEAIPVGSYAEFNDPSTIVAPTQDHTLGLAGYAFVTGLNPGVNDGIGVNDVDGGKTTLLSPIIDLTGFENPIMTYWRWYVNAPPSGANPGTDWWQVELSNDGGATWQYLENTLQQDVSWRRNAFRVADVIEPTDEFRMRFIASDSTTIGEYLDGGSLIEAAVDDIILYDLASGEDIGQSAEQLATGYPNPARDIVTLEGWMVGSTARLYEVASGKIVGEFRIESNVHLMRFDGFSSGFYELVGTDRNGRATQWKLELIKQ
ncbi:MAG: hypothetical protein O2818_01965 [Bacteroidetes bacterium]|nr:hypothetical protein [Bacteroidota bacterium]MDA1335629.1 hypothetical protein [Bacteroidota bacterium]